MTKGIQGGSILDLIGIDEKGRLGIDRRDLGLSLSFRRDERDISSVKFGEFPYMGRDSRDIYHHLTKGVNVQLLSEGLTEIFVGVKGEVRVHVNKSPRENDPFSRAILNEHLCTKFDINGRVQRLKEELDEIGETPVRVHEIACRTILEKFLINAKESGRMVRSADEVHFTFRCPEKKKNLLPVDEDEPYVVVPLPLANDFMSYEFFVAWVRVFGSSYRTLVDLLFYEMAQKTFGKNVELVPHTFNLPGTRGFEQ